MATAIKPHVSSTQGTFNCENHQQDSRKRHVLVVCMGEECAHAGGAKLLEELEHECRHAGADVRVGASRCLGHCQLAPAMMEDGKMLGWVSPRRLHSELSRLGIKG